jgi:hypothetical protein
LKCFRTRAEARLELCPPLPEFRVNGLYISWVTPRDGPETVNMVIWAPVKTTIEIPDPLFRKAKSKAAERGQTLKELVTEALQEKLAGITNQVRPRDPEWMQGFGQLRRLRKETKRIQSRIDEAFEVIEPEDRA